jgi:FkbM family methyltransferase
MRLVSSTMAPVADREERALRDRYFETAREMTPLLGVESDGVMFVVPTWDDRVARKLFVARRRQEMKVLRCAIKILSARGRKPGGTFIDVGANIGTTCLPALTLGFERAIAIEPDIANARLLRANAELNGLADRLTVIEAAASDACGTLRLRRHPTNSGAHRIASDGVPVRAVTLDDILVGEWNIGMLWIDVQGHEQEVLAGAREIARCTPTVVEVRRRDVSTFTNVEAIDLREALGTTVRDEGYTDVLLLPAAG